MEHRADQGEEIECISLLIALIMMEPCQRASQQLRAPSLSGQVTHSCFDLWAITGK
jgi:hypothetical protein